MGNTPCRAGFGRGGAVGENMQLSGGTESSRRQRRITRNQPRQYRRFPRPRNQEYRMPAAFKRGVSQCDARLASIFGDRRPPVAFAQGSAVRKQRSKMTIISEAKQGDVKQWAFRDQPVAPVKALKFGFICACRRLRRRCSSWDWVNVRRRSRNAGQKRLPCKAKIASRVVMRNKALVAPEPVYSRPGKSAGPSRLRKPPVQRSGRGAAG